MPKITDSQVHQALQKLVDSRNAPALNYAVNYAAAGIGMHGHELYVQVLYVLNNMSSWRGEVAKEVRATLKQFAKENTPK